MLSRTVLALLLFLCSALPGVAQENPIALRMKAFVDAYNAGDVRAIADIFTEDGAMLIPRGGIIAGREAISKFFDRAIATGGRDMLYKILEIRQAGPATAVEIGETLQIVQGQKVASRSMHVWVLKDGTWYLSRDMYHVLGPVK